MGERQLVSAMCLAACGGPVCTLPPPRGSQAHVSEVYNLHPALKEAAWDGVHDSGGSLFPTGSDLSCGKGPASHGLKQKVLIHLLDNLHDTTDQVKFSQVK